MRRDAVDTKSCSSASKIYERDRLHKDVALRHQNHLDKAMLEQHLRAFYFLRRKSGALLWLRIVLIGVVGWGDCKWQKMVGGVLKTCNQRPQSRWLIVPMRRRNFCRNLISSLHVHLLHGCAPS